MRLQYRNKIEIPLICDTLKQQNIVSVTGHKEAKQRQGYKFSLASTYLTEHVFLTRDERLTIVYLSGKAVSYDALNRGQEVNVHDDIDLNAIANALGMSRSTVKRAMRTLTKVGIVRARANPKDGRKKSYVLLPGPWPLLGDLPQRLLNWRDIPGWESLVGEWRKIVLSGQADEHPLATLGAFLTSKNLGWLLASTIMLPGFSDEGKEETLKKLLDVPKKKAKCGSKNVGHTEPHLAQNEPQCEETDNQEKPAPQRDFLDLPRARARPLIDSKDNSNDKWGKQSAGSPDGSHCAVSDHPKTPPGGYTPNPPAVVRPSGAPISPNPKSRLETEKGLLATPKKTRPPAPQKTAEQVLKETLEWKPKKTAKPVDVLLSHYRKHVSTMFDIDLTAFTVAERSAAKQIINRYGLDLCGETVSYVFKYWTAYYRKNLKLKTHKFPPLFLFVSKGWMENLVQHAKDGKPPASTSWLAFNDVAIAAREDTHQYLLGKSKPKK